MGTNWVFSKEETEFYIELCKDLQLDQQEVQNERWEVTYPYGKRPTETYPLVIRVHGIIMVKGEERRPKHGCALARSGYHSPPWFIHNGEKKRRPRSLCEQADSVQNENIEIISPTLLSPIKIMYHINPASQPCLPSSNSINVPHAS